MKTNESQSSTTHQSVRPKPFVEAVTDQAFFSTARTMPPAFFQLKTDGTLLQRARMEASKAELEQNQERGKWVSTYLSMLNSTIGKYRYTLISQGDSVSAIRNSDGTTLSLHEVLLEFFNYDKNPDKTSRTSEQQKLIREEFSARYFHDSQVGSIELSEKPDIESSFSALKACVITALMYVEGGTVMGTSSVEELHLTLTTRFPDTWGQYSDDNIIPSIYTYFGYKEQKVSGKRADVVKKAGYKAGMVGSKGHMVGFKQVGTKPLAYNFRDNESVEAKADVHPRKDDQAIVIWHK